MSKSVQRGDSFDWLKDGQPKTGTGRGVPGRKNPVMSRGNGRKIQVDNTVVEGKPVPGKTEKLPDRRKGDRRQ